MANTKPIKPLTGQSRDWLELVMPAAATGHMAALEHYLEADPRFLHVVGPHGRTMLWEAARKGKLDAVRMLLDAGADLERRGCYHRETQVELSPWCIATVRKKTKVADYLREHGAEYLLDSACFLGDLAEVERVIAADPSALDRAIPGGPEEVPLHYALAGRQRTVFDWLLDRGADVTAAGALLLSWSFGEDDESYAEQLLRRGARPRPGDANEACLESRWANVLAPYGYEVDLDAPNRLGFPPLIEACRGNHNASEDTEELQQWLARGARVDVTDHKGKTAMHRAAQAGFVGAIDVLVAAGGDVQAVDNAGETPLFDAVRAGRVAAVSKLLTHGADLEHANNLGQLVAAIAKRSKKVDAASIRQLLG